VRKDGKAEGREYMTARGVDFLENWIAKNVTERVKQSVDGDAASLSIELAERAIADAAKAGLSLTDLEPEFGTPETIIREALDTSEGAHSCLKQK
jgi:hypothetical protein